MEPIPPYNFGNQNINQSPMNNMQMNQNQNQNQNYQPDDDMNMRPVNNQDFQSNPENNWQGQSSSKKDNSLMDMEMEEEMLDEVGQHLQLQPDSGNAFFSWGKQDYQNDPNMEYSDISCKVALNDLRYGRCNDAPEERDAQEYDMGEQETYFNAVTAAFADYPTLNQPNMGLMNSGSKANQPVTNLHVFNCENAGNNV